MSRAKFYNFLGTGYKSKDAHQYYRIGNNTQDEITLGSLDDSPKSFILRPRKYAYLTGEELQSMGYIYGRGILQGIYSESKENPTGVDLGDREKISVTPLGIDRDTGYKIINRTAKYIESFIKNLYDNYDTDPISEVSIPRMHPFSTIVMKSEEFMMSNFLEIQRDGLIQVEREDQVYKIWDWIRLKPLTKWFKKLFTKDTSVIGKIKDDYYYRINNQTKEKITLKFAPDYIRFVELPNIEDPKNIQVFKGVTLKDLGKETIQNMYDSYLINLEPLEIRKDTNYKISNRTATTIRILTYDAKKSLFLTPFATKFINSDELKLYDFLEKQRDGLIQIERKDQVYKVWDWIILKPIADRFKKIATKDSDVIGKIRDDYYYRLNNKTEIEIELTILSKDGSERTPYVLPRRGDSQNMKVFSGITLNAVGKEKILDLVNSNLINFQPLELKVDTDYKITNRTERRIGIINYNQQNRIVIPPLGTRLITSDKLKWYDFLEWFWQDLILVELDDQSFISSVGLSRLRDWIKLLPGLVLVGLAGIGIPLWIVYYYGGGAGLIESGDIFTITGLGRIFQLGFICIASILPALFYYLFGRQQVEKLREKFFRDVLVMDPHIYTLSGAEAKYDTLLNSAFGSGSASSPLAILLLIFSTALLVTGWTLTLTPYGLPPEGATSLIQFFIIDPKPLTLGFLGVYFFSINMIFRRYVRADLTPKTYASIIVRLLVSLVLVFTIGAIGVLDTPGPTNYAVLAVAFMIGVFPEDGFRIIRDSARKIVPKRFRDDAEDKFPITQLEGMNQYDQARLLEEGIENIENLAHHNLIDLLAFTRIPTARLVDMFDQAILYLHLGIFDKSKAGDKPNDISRGINTEQFDTQPDSDKESSDNKLLQYLKSLGVRTATDLIEILDDKHKSDTEYIIGRDKITHISHLRMVAATLEDDEWLSFIMTWKREAARGTAFNIPIATDPHTFFESTSKEPDNSTNKTQPSQVGMLTESPTDAPVDLPSS